MHAIDEINLELHSLLTQHFHVLATHSQRQDQWYKRSYQELSAKHGHCKALILVPCESQAERIPHARHFASAFAKKLRAASDERIAQKSVISQKSVYKLFPDSVIDRIHNEHLARAVTGHEHLPPFAMQVSGWTSDDGLIFSGPHRRKGIIGLIACGEIDVLFRLATLPQTNPPKGEEIDPFTWRIINWDWQDVIDDILIIMVFPVALDAFPNDFLVQEGYRLWVPVAFRVRNRNGTSPLL
ncbi:hypothetical protein FHETE_7142 [Fusarium heterosporum]|uniref:Uncharacterized protein n=1 Tax=Fusarium heterosporum TaxID=42747 RepID=A0A8H5T7W8_FUSHE|nr:hypothetical protein FHETE_7142 [Fusarium heterosporum]